MGVDTKIILSPHAKAEQVLEVIQKIIGVEFEYHTFEKVKPDFAKPSSKDNAWHCKPKESSDNYIKLEAVDYFTLHFKDCAGNQYYTLFHLDNEDYDTELSKLMGPRSTGVWCAIGKRLVDFFGGKMMYADCNDWDDPNNWYISKNSPKYPMKVKGQSGDDRWYQYYNALNNEPILDSKEILDMQSRTAYWSEREDTLVEKLEYNKYILPKINLANELSETLPEQSEIQKPKKVKI
jgi:hypothetical protein